MNAADLSENQAPVAFTLNGQPVQAAPGESLLKVAQRLGVAIPRLCHTDGLRSPGNCRACVVEVAGERVLAPSCCRAPQPGMVVSTHSPRARAAQKTVLELLLSDAPDTQALKHDSELVYWAQAAGAQPARFPARAPVPSDTSHPAMAVNLDACIQCTRCVRACRETQGNDVLGLAFRGGHAQIVFDQGDPMGASTCVACGECVQACPTGAIAPANGAYAQASQQQVDSLCPFCGVGCQLTYHVTDGKIEHVEGQAGPANEGRLCVKGRFGFDYAHSPERLTRPLIRLADAPKDPASVMRRDWRELFREATWDEALDAAAAGFQRAMASTTARGRLGPVAGFGSAKGTNEEAYLFQKLIRSAFGTHNVDHCTRLCHASSVAALMEGLGSAVVTNPLRDVQHADFMLIIGANPAQNHPVGATWIKNAVKKGARLVMADPRRTELARFAWKHLGFQPGTDVALLNAMLHTIIFEGLANTAYIEQHTLDFAQLKAHVADFSPEAMAPVCGIDAATLREVARAYATAGNSMILWGMGVSQHTHGTDNARCLIALSLITGQIGRPGTGLHPLRGQNNVQGASDAGLIPMVLPDYQRVSEPAVRAKAEQLWGVPAGTLGSEPGLTVVEIVNAAFDGQIRAMLVQGENPAMSDPDATHAREALARLDHLVVQDIFLTETASLADVVLPATAWPEKTGSVTNTDRCVQLGRKAVPAPGEARADAWITEQLARRLGLGWAYGVGPDGTASAQASEGVGAVFEEMRALMPSIAGLSWARLQREGAVTYPVAHENDPGHAVVFTDQFPTPTGRATLVPAALTPPAEMPDADYPMVLITGRQLEHWHTGSMTRRSQVLDAVEPGPVVSLHPDTAARSGLAAGDDALVQSRRGSVVLAVRLDQGMPPDTAFIPFAYAEAAANLLTNPALDPLGKIAELKYCAVNVRAATL
ncbi:MAG: formate dehydrogenase subunit alpha [Hydrogenophaga sp.]|uniref:formate dehydrogenase subunit alpha n=1 Tax=Hydrogenophaga sp. TaxID=1904254 RepID=UPI002722F1C4|nr:formate dehydrogenase subunit alpha [Hydrogenophaga sp.]MDO9147710.1 formate dehydrogenase subunit alpha [Hydrogenophaga sp.]MDO9606423.1 formate dehydrogenase subunit alpha [Hydrogenophaga sp.]